MNEINMANNERAFCALVRRHIHRDGVEELLEYLHTETDFSTHLVPLVTISVSRAGWLNTRFM